MNEPLSHQIGVDGFVWWMGVIENTSDPLKVGRAKVRILGWHTEELSGDELPWGVALAPTTHPNTVPALNPGDWVVGFFLDASLGQQPVILGVLPAIPKDGGMFGKLAKFGLKTLIKSQTGISI